MRAWLLVAAAVFAGCNPVREADLFIAVEITRLPEGMIVTALPVQGIELAVAGPRDSIDALTRQNLTYELDLSQVAAGVQSIAVDPAGLTLPKGVVVRSLAPRSLSVKVEPEAEKTVPVQLVLAGKPAAGLKLTAARLQVQQVVLKGPQRVLAAIAEVSTKPVDVTGIEDNTRREVAFELDRLVSVATPAEAVMVEIEVGPTVVTRTVEPVAVKGRDTPFLHEISPATACLKLQGPERVIEGLRNDGRATIHLDLQGLKPGVYVRQAVIALPVSVTLLGIDPEIFTVKILDRRSPPGNDSPGSTPAAQKPG